MRKALQAKGSRLECESQHGLVPERSPQLLTPENQVLTQVSTTPTQPWVEGLALETKLLEDTTSLGTTTMVRNRGTEFEMPQTLATKVTKPNLRSL